MSLKLRKKYDQDFKRNAVLLCAEPDRSIVEIAESFFHTLKTQLVYHIRFNNFNEAERILFKYIEIYYNQRRKHSANGWKAPAHCEQEWYNLKNVA